MAVEVLGNAVSTTGEDITSLTVSIAVETSGTDRILIAGASSKAGGERSLTGTYNAVATNSIGLSTGSNNVDSFLHRLIEADSTSFDGTNYNLVLTWDNEVTAGIIGAHKYQNVNQTTPADSPVVALGTSTAASVAVTSEVGDMVVDCVTSRNNAATLSAGPGQTEQYNDFTGSGNTGANGAGSYEAGSTTVSMAWAVAAAQRWSIIAVNLNATTSTGAPVGNVGVRHWQHQRSYPRGIMSGNLRGVR